MRQYSWLCMRHWRYCCRLAWTLQTWWSVFRLQDAGTVELDDLVGMFVNAVVLRTPVHGTDSFSGLLARVKEIDLSSLANSDVPFERLVEVLNPVRSQSHNPIFRVESRFRTWKSRLSNSIGCRPPVVKWRRDTLRSTLDWR